MMKYLSPLVPFSPPLLRALRGYGGPPPLSTERYARAREDGHRETVVTFEGEPLTSFDFGA